VLLPIGLGTLIGVFVCLWCRVTRAKIRMGSLLDADRMPNVTLIEGDSKKDGLGTTEVVATDRVAPTKLPKEVVDLLEIDDDQSQDLIAGFKSLEVGGALPLLQSNGCHESAGQSVEQVETLEGHVAQEATQTSQASGRSRQVSRGIERNWRSFAMSESEAASIGVGDVTLSSATTEASPKSSGDKPLSSSKLSAATGVLLKRMTVGSDSDGVSLPLALLTNDDAATTAIDLDVGLQLAKLQSSFGGEVDEKKPTPNVSTHAERNAVATSTLDVTTPSPNSAVTGPHGVSFTGQSQPFTGRSVPAALLRARSASEVKRSAMGWLQQTSDHMRVADSKESTESKPTSPMGPHEPFGADTKENKQKRSRRV